MPVIKTPTGEQKWVEVSDTKLPPGAPKSKWGGGYAAKIIIGMLFCGYFYYKINRHSDSWYNRTWLKARDTVTMGSFVIKNLIKKEEEKKLSESDMLAEKNNMVMKQIERDLSWFKSA